MQNTLTCRQAVQLMLEDEDHELGPEERIALQVHVRICFSCARFVGQLNFMRRTARAWRKHCES